MRQEKIIKEIIEYTEHNNCSFSPILGADSTVMRHIQDISSAFRISKKLAYKLINEEQINGFLVGRKWLVAKEWVIDYLCAQINVKKR